MRVDAEVEEGPKHMDEVKAKESVGMAWLSRRRNLLFKKFTILLAVGFALVSCSNIYEPLSSKTSDDAYYEDALKALDDQNYDLAITKFQAITPGYLSKVEVRENYAGALAGKCGLQFSTFYNSLSSADFSTTPFFLYFMKAFREVAVSPTHCTQAEEQIKAIWQTNTPTASQQLFMSILSMAKMGTYLRNKADNDDGTDNLGDGSTDAGFDGCANTDDDDHLTDDEVTEVITGFSLMLTNITGFAATLGMSNTIDAMTAICALAANGLCSTTEAASVTDPMREGMRDILNTGITSPVVPLGIGSCAPIDQTTLDACCP